MTISRSNALAVLAGAFAGALHVWGRYRDWWWYDNLAHACAGLALGSAIGTTDSDRGQDMAFVALLTTAWEAFEHWHGVRPWAGGKTSDSAAEDTVLDTILVLACAWLGSTWSKD